MFLEISQNSQENTCARVFFLNKVFFKKRGSGTGVFLWILRNYLRTLFLQNTSGRLVLVHNQKSVFWFVFFFILWFFLSLNMIFLYSLRACNIKYLIFTQNLKQPGCSHIMLLASRNKINRWSWKRLWLSITRPRYYSFCRGIMNWIFSPA